MYVSAPLHPTHDLSSFDCGEPALDDWLRRAASNAEDMRTSRTFVWADGDAVVAYYAINAHLLERDLLPRRLGSGGPVQVPAVMIGKLALDKSLQGQGLGAVLLADALERIVEATETVAARFVVVDAIGESAGKFWEHMGFIPIPETARLVRKMSAIAADLAAE